MQCRALQSVKDTVSITPGGRGKPRMERVADRRNPGDTYVVGKITVGTQQPASPTTFAPGVEVHHLSRCMNTCVGAAGANHFDRFVRNQRKCLFHPLLHTETGLLPLPAIITGAVVFDAQCDANVWTR